MIEFKHVDKVYPNGVKGLQDINLTIDQGEFVAIIGLSGAGKSTLIRTINRMIDVTNGQLIVDGTDVMTLKGRAMRRYRRKIGMIFQSYNLVTRATAIKNVLTSMVPDMNFFRVLFGLFSKEQKMHALEALDKVGILDKAYTRCDQLSGGQQQRVAIARALMLDPAVLFFDEPTSALYPELTGEILKVIRDLAAEHMTMVIVTHEMAFARDVSDYVIFMDGGVIVEQGNPANIINNPTQDRTIQFLARFN